MLTKDRIVDTRDKIWASSKIILFNNALYDLLWDRTIVEFLPKQYINISELNEMGITRETLENYCESVYEFVENKKYFTIKSIREEGFYHELDELGFDDWFYSSLIACDLERFSYRKMGGRRLFLSGKKQIILGSFIEYILEEKNSMTIKELEQYLLQKYGIKIDRYKLYEVIKDTSLYYDSIEATVYKDYNAYMNS